MTNSLWLEGSPPPGSGLDGRDEADVVIIGGGFTGLWTAYYLSKLAPDRTILILEAEHVGFGATGRNGGWCTSEMPTLLATLARKHGPMDAMRFYRAVRRTLDEIEKVLAAEDIPGAWQRDGSLYLARTEPQRERLLGWRDLRQRLGIGDMTFWDGPAARTELHAPRILTAAFTPRWEPEPLRLLGVRAAATWADRYEDRYNRTAPVAPMIMRAVL